MSCSLQCKLLHSLDTSAFTDALPVSDGATLPSCAAFGSANNSSGAPWTVRRLAASPIAINHWRPPRLLACF